MDCSLVPFLNLVLLTLFSTFYVIVLYFCHKRPVLPPRGGTWACPLLLLTSEARVVGVCERVVCKEWVKRGQGFHIEGRRSGQRYQQIHSVKDFIHFASRLWSDKGWPRWVLAPGLTGRTPPPRGDFEWAAAKILAAHSPYKTWVNAEFLYNNCFRPVVISCKR
jgi:hypothetical protein